MRNEAIELLKELKKKNPYPESVFIEPTHEQLSRFHQILQKEGLTLDKFSGSISRRLWDVVIDEIIQALSALEQKGPVEKCKWIELRINGGSDGYKTECGSYTLHRKGNYCPFCGKEIELSIECEVKE